MEGMKIILERRHQNMHMAHVRVSHEFATCNMGWSMAVSEYVAVPMEQ